MITTFVVYLCIGAVAGTLAGLIGIGGGLVVVPALSWILVDLHHYSLTEAMRFAVGSSLVCILMTSSSSAFHHLRKGNVNTQILIKLIPGLLVGVLLGSYLRGIVSGEFLQGVFGGFALFVAVQMIVAKKIQESRPLPAGILWLFYGAIVGAFSSMLGLGGGVILVPLFHFYQLEMRVSVGTASICGWFIALSALIVNLLGANHVYWQAVIGISIASVACAPLGVKLVSWLHPLIVKRIFATALLVIALKMIIGLLI